MQDGCKVYTDPYVASHGSRFMVTWIIFKNLLLEVVLTLNQDHGTSNSHNRWFILFYNAWGLAWIKFHWKNSWLRGPVTYDFTLHSRVRYHTSWCWRCIGTTAFGHFLLGSHNSMATTLGSSVQDWSPHMGFILKGSQISALQLHRRFKSKTLLQVYRNEIQNSYETCAWIIWYLFSVV